MSRIQTRKEVSGVPEQTIWKKAQEPKRGHLQQQKSKLSQTRLGQYEQQNN
jgi:hypothetical protein